MGKTVNLKKLSEHFFHSVIDKSGQGIDKNDTNNIPG